MGFKTKSPSIKIEGLGLLCRPPCTIFELIYNGPKAIGRHCCLIINTLGSFFSYEYLNKNGKYEN